MTITDPFALGSIAVLGTSIIIVTRPPWSFGQKLSLEGGAFSLLGGLVDLLGALVIYIGLKLPLGLSRDANAWTD